MKKRHKFYADDPPPLARFIQELCAERGISFTQACMEMGVSTSTISNIGHRRYNPSINTLKAIADWANRPITTILELAGYIEPPKYSDKAFHALMERVTVMDEAGLMYLAEQADFWLWSVRRIRRRKQKESKQ